MTATGSPDSSRRSSWSGPSSGTTCRASAIISLSVFMESILSPFAVRSTAIRSYTRLSHERHHPRRRLWDTALSADPRPEQAARPGLQQADDLLPALDADARRHPGHPDYYDAGRPGIVSAPARRWP